MCQRLSLARVEMLLVRAEHTEALWSLGRHRREDKSTRWLTSGYGTLETCRPVLLVSVHGGKTGRDRCVSKPTRLTQSRHGRVNKVKI
jgi:hypothetical protein